MELLTKDTHLDFSSDDGSTWLELYGLESYPDMGADPPKVKVTNMRDANERYIGGIPDISDMKFGFFYNKEKDPDAGTMIKKNFAKRYHHKVALLHKGVRYNKVGLVNVHIVEEQDVDVDGAVVIHAVFRLTFAPQLPFYALRGLEHLSR